MTDTADCPPPPGGVGALGRRNRLIWQFLSLIWLTVLIGPLTDALDSSYSVAEKVVIGAAATGFVISYLLVLRAVRRPVTRGTYAGLAVMAGLLAVLAIVDHWSWLNAAAFVSVSIGMRLPTPRAVRAVVVLTVATVALAAVLGADADSVYSIGLTCFAVGFLSVGIRRIFEVNTELHVAREDLARLAVAEERDRFARDLHDLLGHSLSVIALKSEVGQRLASTDPARAEAELREIEAVARDALREVREAVGGYRRPTLATEVAGARDALGGAGIDVDARIEATGLRPDVEAVLAWAVREGATNVLRHSRARHCTIEVGIDGHEGAAVVSVVDDGLGASGPQQPGTGPSGAGLLGLAERATAVGGRLESGPRRDGGFALRMWVPVGVVA
jgi:two-component system sensor histidine kinase DesK